MVLFVVVIEHARGELANYSSSGENRGALGDLWSKFEVL
jgi:hypothetical protein